MSERSKKLSRAVSSIDGFQLWSTVEHPLVMRSRITSLNRAMKCGGIPGGMLGVLHGPSQGGKTLLLAELLYDAWRTGGWGLFADAECRAVDLRWFRAICGAIEEIAYFKPQTFELAISRIQEFRGKFRAAKKAKDVPENAFLVIGVDSINRLTPATELDEILEGKVAPRGYPLRALLTSKWLDKIIPTLERDEVVVFVQREGRKMDVKPGQKTWTLKGGSAIAYDAGWSIRVTAAGRQKCRDDDKGGALCGEKHSIELEKNSLGPHLNEIANFYSSTGAEEGMPLGLDFAREVREETINRGFAVYKKGTGYLFRRETVAESKREYLAWIQAEEDGQPRWVRLQGELDADEQVDAE